MTLLTRVVLLLVGALACASLAWLALTHGERAPSDMARAARMADAVETGAEPGRERAPASAPLPPTTVDGSEAPPPRIAPSRSAAPSRLPSPPARLPPSAVPPTPGPAGLIVPVSGIMAAQLADTFGDARGNERQHEALDIMAPAGTPVLAVADGHVEKLFDSDRGGLTIYQFEPSGRYAYYYAHLQRYAPGLVEGQALRQGQVIGYVGSTGNADPAAPHLHFAIFLLGPEREWWRGTAVNPYPLLGGR